MSEPGGAAKAEQKADKAKKTKQEKYESRELKSDNDTDTSILKLLWEYDNKSELINQTLKLVKRLFKAVFNMKILANVTIGTGSPDTTGLVLGLCAVASCFERLNINAQGDFENKDVSGSVNIKGRIFICAVVWALVLFIFNKSIYPLIKKLLFKRG